MAEFSNDQKRDIIIAAITAAGPGADDGQVASQVTRIVDLFEDGSTAMRAFERAEKRAESTTQTKGFTGDLLFVDLEESSNRPILFLRTQVSEYAPDGIEVARMDRVDSQDSERVRALANQARALVGHKVGVTIAIEKTSNNKNARILRGIEDRGAGSTPGLTNDTGWQQIDWVNGGKDGAFARLAPKLKRLQQYQAALAGAQQPALAGV